MRTRRIRPHERRPLPNGMLVDRIASSWKLILLTALFAAGMAFGAVSVKYSANHEWLEQLLQLLQEYSTIRNSQSLFSTMCNSLFSNLIYLSVAFIAGLCAIGFPFLALAPFGSCIRLLIQHQSACRSWLLHADPAAGSNFVYRYTFDWLPGGDYNVAGCFCSNERQ